MNPERLDELVDQLHEAETSIDFLRALVALRDLIDRALPETIQNVIRSDGAAAAARVLGVTRQAVSWRFSAAKRAGRASRPAPSSERNAQ